MSPVNINSLISSTVSFLPGSIKPAIQPPGQLPGQPQVRPSEDTFIQGEPFKVRATSKGVESGASSPPIYTRAAAAGKSETTHDAGQTESSEEAAATNENNVESSEDASVEQSSESQTQNAAYPAKANGEPLSQSEVALLEKLKEADQSVRAHERAHIAAAGGYAKGGATYSYKRGPDGKNYAVGGEVQIDMSTESSTAATVQKMKTVRRAALAPADPSPQDQKVAAQATLRLAESLSELQLEKSASSRTNPQVDTGQQSEGKSAQGVYQEYGQAVTGVTPQEPAGNNFFFNSYKQSNASQTESNPSNGLELIA